MTLADIKKNWAAIILIGGIVGTTLYGWNYAMAQVKDVARTEVQATVNKEMVDGAKRAASDAVKEQLPEISKQTAKELIKQLKEEQMLQPHPAKTAPPK